jgi:hypothetical protein
MPEQLRRENAQAIASFDVSSVYNGYLCGGCDPFLLLITHLVGVKEAHEVQSAWTWTLKSNCLDLDLKSRTLVGL